MYIFAFRWHSLLAGSPEMIGFGPNLNYISSPGTSIVGVLTIICTWFSSMLTRSSDAFFISNKAVPNGAVLSHIDRHNHKVSSRIARTEVAQLKKTNAEKTKQVATLRQDCEDLQERCSAQAKELGDAALSSGKYEEAIACYTSALSLSSAHAVDILVKRSSARASKGSWEDALTDAIEVRVLWFLWLH